MGKGDDINRRLPYEAEYSRNVSVSLNCPCSLESLMEIANTLIEVSLMKKVEFA
jgi:hypothetical protein